VGIELDSQLVSEANKKARNSGVARQGHVSLNRSFQGGHFRGHSRHLVLAAVDQFEASAETDAGTQSGHAHCLAQVRHGSWKPEQELIVRGVHVFLWTIPDKQTP
jgi:hypothetical protein